MAFGTTRERQKLFDMGPDPLTRIGASGSRKNGGMTRKATQTGGAGDGVRQTRSTTHFEQPNTGSPATLERFRESARGLLPDDPKLTNIEARARAKKQTLPVKGVQSIPEKVGGTTRVGRKARGGNITHAASGVPSKKAGVFTEKGINEIFGSAADLAKLFASKEFQQRKARGIQSAMGVKGRRADAKAKTDRITALSGVLEDLSVSGGDNESLMSRIQDQIQNLITGGDGSGVSTEVITKLSSKFSDEQIKTILGIIR